jgi:hypothetical protein
MIMTENNRPAFRAVVAEEKGQGDKAKTHWTPIGAAWPTKSGKGYNVHLPLIPVNWDGRFTLVEADEVKATSQPPAEQAA